MDGEELVRVRVTDSEDVGPTRWATLLGDVVRMLATHPYWLALTILSIGLHQALAPGLAWMGKSLVDRLNAGSLSSGETLMEALPVFGGVIVGLAVLKFGEKVLGKVYETRLVICLQRAYLERRERERDAEDISRILWDCKQAKKGLEVLYKDSWKMIVGTVSVIVWQMTLAPKWLPALLISVAPSLLAVFAFGPFIQKASLDILHFMGKVAVSTSSKQQEELYAHQESLFWGFVRFEVYRGGAEVVMELLMWIGVLLLLLTVYVFDLGILPREIQAGDLALYAVNLNLLSKPIGEIGKTYNKCREAYPALVRVLRPAPAPQERQSV
jgi:hypothetical protein